VKKGVGWEKGVLMCFSLSKPILIGNMLNYFSKNCLFCLWLHLVSDLPIFISAHNFSILCVVFFFPALLRRGRFLSPLTFNQNLFRKNQCLSISISIRTATTAHGLGSCCTSLRAWEVCEKCRRYRTAGSLVSIIYKRLLILDGNIMLP